MRETGESPVIIVIVRQKFRKVHIKLLFFTPKDNAIEGNYSMKTFKKMNINETCYVLFSCDVVSRN